MKREALNESIDTVDLDRCSRAAAEEPLTGTAPQAKGWLLLESDQSWPRAAVTTLVPSNIQSWASELSYSILLIRQRPRVETLKASSHRYWISGSDGNIHHGSRSDFDQIPDLTRSQPSQPLLIVCTNGKRDQCCAIEGNSLIKNIRSTLRSDMQSQVWEGTHLGGHRFAPTALYLPGNLILGRLNSSAAVGLIEHGQISSDFIRGRTHLSPCLQILASQVKDFDQINWVTEESCMETTHVHRGEFNGVDVEFVLSRGPERTRVESCGASPVTSMSYTLEGPLNAD
jgi:hypothetical protein